MVLYEHLTRFSPRGVMNWPRVDTLLHRIARSYRNCAYRVTEDTPRDSGPFSLCTAAHQGECPAYRLQPPGRSGSHQP